VYGGYCPIVLERRQTYRVAILLLIRNVSKFNQNGKSSDGLIEKPLKDKGLTFGIVGYHEEGSAQSKLLANSSSRESSIPKFWLDCSKH
jgi:hypothetical protein